MLGNLGETKVFRVFPISFPMSRVIKMHETHAFRNIFMFSYFVLHAKAEFAAGKLSFFAFSVPIILRILMVCSRETLAFYVPLFLTFPNLFNFIYIIR